MAIFTDIGFGTQQQNTNIFCSSNKILLVVVWGFSARGLLFIIASNKYYNCMYCMAFCSVAFSKCPAMDDAGGRDIQGRI